MPVFELEFGTIEVEVAVGIPGPPGPGSGGVDSVNGDTGVVVLTAADVGADATGTAAAGDAAHVGASDPHPQYLTAAEGDAAYDTNGAAAAAQAASDPLGTATSAVSAHAGASDPHGDRAAAVALVDDLSGVTNASTARTNLGLGTAATQATGAFDAAGAATAAQAAAVQRANHTGTQSADTLTDGTTNKAFLATERTKLAGIATAATANDTDANLKARANHTGTQPASTISDFTAASNAVVPTIGAALATTGTIDLDLSTLHNTYQTITLTGNPTFTSSNKAAGKTVTLKLTAGASPRTLAFPAWIFVGAVAPTTLASGKVGLLTVTFFDTTDAAAVAAWAAQP